ncbi:MAG: hypothetical protein M0R80_02570 [Proteobacteria bacterium]|jgi:hypothetical protein|nr:hypothetical protein [Pseudomonadota bacterium]
MIKTFQEYREEQYLEMAMQGLSNVALFNDARLVGLYNADAMKIALEKGDWQEMMKTIVGAASFRKNSIHNANESTGIASQHGYGPLLYLLLMHRSPNGLIPNRVAREINADAKRVWQQFIEGAGKDLVTTEPLVATGDSPWKGEIAKHHKEPYLNLRFRLKAPLPGIKEAELRNKNVIGWDQYGKKREKIAYVFTKYLDFELGQVYPEVSEIMEI